MVANLYLHPDTFKYNGSDTRQQVEGKLKMLVSDMTDVLNVHKDENTFKVPTSLALTPLYQDICIYEMASSCLSADEAGVFFPIMANTSENYDNLSVEQLHEMCRYHENETEVNSMLVLNQPEDYYTEDEKKEAAEQEKKNRKSVVTDYITFDDYKVVYSKQTWTHLRRQILGNHPGEPKDFILECRKYFTNLSIHDNCVVSLVDDDFEYLKIIPRRIVYYLSCLNDKFEDVRIRHKTLGSNPNVILADFSGMFGFDKEGSLQQRPEKKPYLTFVFNSPKGSSYSVLCEPHLKIEHEDCNCKIKNIKYDRFHPRIYFSYTNPEVANGKILVGSIGKHI